MFFLISIFGSLSRRYSSFSSKFFFYLNLWFLIPQIFQFFFQVFFLIFISGSLSPRYSSFSSKFFLISFFGSYPVDIPVFLPRFFLISISGSLSRRYSSFSSTFFLISISGSLPRLVLAFFDSAILLFSDSSQTFLISFSSVPAALFLYL